MCFYYSFCYLPKHTGDESKAPARWCTSLATRSGTSKHSLNVEKRPALLLRSSVGPDDESLIGPVSYYCLRLRE